MKELITFVMTSCGRIDLLKRTLGSFLHQTPLLKQYIIIDNSTDPVSHREIEGFLRECNIPGAFITNKENIGQVASIDIAYSFVQTPYIFHCEDDWEFFETPDNFLEKSLDILEFDSKILNINLRERFNHEASSQHPVGELRTTARGTAYHEYIPGYHGIWHGFAWNPGLRRLSDYDLIKPYKQHRNEEGVGGKYYELGFRSACLEKPYCRHIGVGQHTFKRNE